MKKHLIKTTFVCFVFVFCLKNNCLASQSETIVDQQTMLNLINNNLQVDTRKINDQYFNNIFCYPPIFLTSGNCYINWAEFSTESFSKDLALKAAILKYSLTNHNGIYHIIYNNDNSITINLINMTEQINHLPTPTSISIDNGAEFASKPYNSVNIERK